jgi:hypothetical protein
LVVTALDTHGDTLYRRRFPLPLDSVPRGVADSAENAARIRGASGRLVFPRLYPPIRTAIVDRDGGVWVQLRPADGRIDWIILDPSGESRGRVDIPDTVQLVAMSQHLAWGIERRNQRDNGNAV